MADVEDIDLWLDALANRPDPEGTKDAEALALRAAVLRQTAEMPAPTQEHTDQAWHRMAFRLRQEGLSASRPPRTRLWIASAAAAVLVIAAGVNVFRLTQPIDAVQFSDEAPSPVRAAVIVVELTSADPMARARAVADAVKSFGVSPVVYRRSQPLVVIFEVPDDKLDAVKNALKQIDVPADRIRVGKVRIEISKSK